MKMPQVLILLFLASLSCDRDQSTPPDQPPDQPVETTSDQTQLNEPASEPNCPALEITVDGDHFEVGTLLGYVGRVRLTDLGHFITAYEADDVECEQIIETVGVVRDGASVRYVSVMHSSVEARFNTVLTTGFSQAGLTDMTFELDDDGAGWQICVPAEVQFRSGDHSYTVIGQLRGPDCGIVDM